MNKLPRITLAFWVMKICATCLGETEGDLLAITLNVGYALSSFILIGIFLATLAVQLSSKRYHPLVFWAVILSSSTVATSLSDYMDRTLGLGYTKGSGILLGVLLVVLAFWRLTIHNLSIENIRSLKVELLFWTAILLTSTLGTALGDLLSDDAGLGFGGASFLISILTAGTVMAHFYDLIPKGLLFWLGFVLTRSLGATMGDLLTKSHERNGMNCGTSNISIILGTLLVLLVIFATPSIRNRNRARAVS